MADFSIADMPPEAREALLKHMVGLGTLTEEQAMLAKQLETAQGIRGRQGPRGRHTGRTYVAANPLEHLADFLGKRKAGKDISSIEKDQGALLEKMGKGRGALMDAWAGSQGESVPGSGGGGPMGPPAPTIDLPPTQNPGMGMPPPQPQMPQPPGLGIPPPNMNVPQDQFNIEAGGDTTRGGGRVSVGGPPPPGGMPPPGISSLGGMPSPAQGPPMTASQKYAEALRKMGQSKSMGYF